jgi:Starch-binding associating with outer membrane/Susd and RagB outer membrane lipoprotein
MKKIYKVLSLIVAMTVVMSCDLSKDLNSPNDVGVSSANPDLLMNKVQTDFALFRAKIDGNHNILTRGVGQLVRFKAMQGDKVYDRAFQPQNFDEIWKDSYQKVLVNIETLIPLAQEKDLNVHVGVAKILKALTYITLVDVFGDVPFTNAIKGTEGNFNPEADAGASIYAGAITLLGEGIASLKKTTGLGLTRDIYYSGNKDRWITLANSIELKAQLNLTASSNSATQTAAKARLTQLFKDNDLIDTDAEEFTYKWGTAAVPAISRNPTYQEYYSVNAGQAGGNIGNKFMQQMYRGLGVQDPRWRYYFYRQVGSRVAALATDPNAIGCGNPPPHYLAANEPFCFVEPGFMGRDHGNNLGTNPDGAALTCVGAYPYGGRIDTNNGDADYQGAAKLGDGGNGKGIENIYMSWFTDFMKAEAILSNLGVAGGAAAARDLMISGVTKSINRTRSFANSLGLALPAGLEPSSVSYLSTLGGVYDLAASNSEKQEVVLREYYKSLWGNGLEAYNMYRRTGSPNNLQLAIAEDPGNFQYSLIYPANYANLNSTVQQKDAALVNRVFWDGKGLILK